MICKWCGGNLREAATKCNRCGKSVPAKSDCGGFYDLIVEPPKEEIPVPRHISEEKPANEQVLISSGRRRPVEEKPSMLPMAINAGVIGLFIIFLLVINSTLSGPLNAARRQSAEIDRLNELVSQEETVPEDADPKETEAPLFSLAEQDAVIRLSAKDSGTALQTECDLGKYEGKITHNIIHSQEFNRKDVQLFLNDEKCATVWLTHTFDQTEQKLGKLNAEFEVDPVLCAEKKGEPEIRWEYRLDGQGDWLQLDAATFTLDPDGRAVTYREDDIAALLQDAQHAELRTVYKVNNMQGGSVTLEISGIIVEVAKETEMDPMLQITMPVVTEPGEAEPEEPEFEESFAPAQ